MSIYSSAAVTFCNLTFACGTLFLVDEIYKVTKVLPTCQAKKD